MRELLEAIERGTALPSEWYADPAIFERERRDVLLRSWHYAAHTGELSEVGDRALARVANVPVVLVRDEVGDVRSFLNICRHRGHTVALDTRRSPTLQCIYHGWTYGLDGRVRAVPRSEREEGFDTSCLGLVEVQVATWGPTVWVNLAANAPSFDEWIAGLPDRVREHGVDMDAAFAYDKTWSIRTNWKLFQENAIECYHCPTCHPELSRVIDTDRSVQTLDIGGRYWVYTGIPLRRSAVTSRTTNGSTDDPPVYHFFWIFPTTYFQYIPGSGFDIGTLDVRSVNEIVFRHLVFLPTDLDAETVARRRAEMEADPTVDQDVALCERVQVSHETGLAPPGRLLPDSEYHLQHFQKLVVEMLLEGELATTARG